MACVRRVRQLQAFKDSRKDPARCMSGRGFLFVSVKFRFGAGRLSLVRLAGGRGKFRQAHVKSTGRTVVVFSMLLAANGVTHHQ